MQYWHLFCRYPKVISFGLINALFSGLGQTHFIALFNPYIISQFGLTNSSYSALYSTATILSALLLSFLGPLVDSKDVRKFCLILGGTIAATYLVFSKASQLWVVFICLLMLRLLCQGLCSHVCWTTIARYFDKSRGKALAISAMGFPLGEVTMTPIFAALLLKLSFTQTLQLVAFIVALVYIPLVFFLTKNESKFNLPDEKTITENEQSKKITRSWTRKEVFSHLGTYPLLLSALIPAFTLTGLFFQASVIAELKGWPIPLMGVGMIGFGLGRIFMLFASGDFIDRYSAQRLFPYYLTPMFFAYLILLLGKSQMTLWLYLILSGVAVGWGGPIKSAMWTELYGTKHLGAIKSTLATVIVLSTGIGAFLYGYLFDQGFGLEPILIASLIGIVVSSFLSRFSLKKSF